VTRASARLLVIPDTEWDPRAWHLRRARTPVQARTVLTGAPTLISTRSRLGAWNITRSTAIHLPTGARRAA